MWISKQVKPVLPATDADVGLTTIAGDRVGLVTRGEVRDLPVPAALSGCLKAARTCWSSKAAPAERSSASRG